MDDVRRGYRHDAFQARGVQGAAACILDLLDEDRTIGRRAIEIAKTLGLNRSTVSRALPKLQEAGLARKSGNDWFRGPATLDQAAEALETTGSLEQLQERHRLEREHYRREQSRHVAQKKVTRLRVIPATASTVEGAQIDAVTATSTATRRTQERPTGLQRPATASNPGNSSRRPNTRRSAPPIDRTAPSKGSSMNDFAPRALAISLSLRVVGSPIVFEIKGGNGRLIQAGVRARE